MRYIYKAQCFKIFLTKNALKPEYFKSPNCQRNRATELCYLERSKKGEAFLVETRDELNLLARISTKVSATRSGKNYSYHIHKHES